MTGLIPDWGYIVTEIAAKIRQHIELYDDYEAFTEVCSTWRLATKTFPSQYINRKHTQLPLLMLVDPDNRSYRRYYSLTKLLFLKIPLPPVLSLPQPKRYFSSRGWLIAVTRNISTFTGDRHYFNISIFNPFSNINNVIIDAPPFSLSKAEVGGWKGDIMMVPFFHKFIVSTCPNAVSDNDFEIAMIFGSAKKVAYWKLGHGDTWLVPDTLGYCRIFDLCFFRGTLYAAQSDVLLTRVISFGDLKDDNSTRVVVALEGDISQDQVPANMDKAGDNFYLVESKCDQGSLLFIHRLILIEYNKEYKYNTGAFNVLKVNVDNGNFERVNSLGNQAIFVGFNSTFGVLVCANVDDRRGCKPDCIYYTDDFQELYLYDKDKGGSGDIGIYSLQHGNTLPCYEGASRFSLINSPTWIELSSASSFTV